MSGYELNQKDIDLLAELPTIKKPHYSWPFHQEMPLPYIDQWARIFGTATFRDKAYDAALLAVYKDTVTKHEANLGILITPLGSDVEPLIFSRYDDICQLWGRMKTLKNELGDVKLNNVLIDIETLSYPEDDEDQITNLHRLIHDIFETLWPGITFTWYGNLIHPGACAGGWAEDNWAVSHIFGNYCTEIYYPTNITLARECMRRNVKEAKALGLGSIIPWVSLNCGRALSSNGLYTSWVSHWDYPVLNDWVLGTELGGGYPGNDFSTWFSGDPERYAPWDWARYVCFYPGPDLVGNAKDFWRHLIAYAHGAAGHDVSSISTL